MIAPRHVPTEAAVVAGLREWLRQVEAPGELVRVSEAVDPNEEMGALTYMVGKRPGSPALLFENPKGATGYRLLWNLLGNSTPRIAVTLGEPPGSSRMELIRCMRKKLKLR